MAKTATLIKARLNGYTGDARLYKVDPPIPQNEWDGEDTTTHEYVVVSGVIAPFSGAETYIFPGDAEGNVVDWGELDGSFRGDIDHEQALVNAGYSIA